MISCGLVGLRFFDADRPGAACLSQERRVAGDAADQADGARRDGVGAAAHGCRAEEDGHRITRRPETDVADLDLLGRGLVEPRPDGDPEVELVAPFVGSCLDGEFRGDDFGQGRVGQLRLDGDLPGGDCYRCGHDFTSCMDPPRAHYLRRAAG